MLLVRTMRMTLAIPMCLILAASDAHGEPVGDSRRAGPAADPYAWPDYGGTPDIATSSETSLSAEEASVLLGRLKSTSQLERSKAAEEMVRAASGSEQVLRQALWGGHGARNTDMRTAIVTARRRAEASKDPGGLLGALIAIDPANQELGAGASGALRVMAMLEALDSQDTMAAYKVMMEFSPRHAGVFRQEIGEMLVKHGLDALPALIYGRGSKDPEIHMFAVKWIRDMGDPLLSQQVKIRNPRRLAQLLEAYASVRELDAIEVTLTLTNHESAFVRESARLCIRAFGENAKWPARRIYENTFAREPAESMPAPKLLDELFDYYDAQRMAPMTELFKSGLAAYQKGRYREMDKAFREVLKTAPMFPKRGEMAKGFSAYADSLMDEGHGNEAEDKLKLAYRLSEPETETSKSIRAKLNWIKAEKLRSAGIADVELYKLVLKDDPDHDGARAWVDKLTNPDASTGRIVAKAAMVSLFLFLAATLVFLRLRS